MTKVTLADVGNLIDATTAATTINSNSAAIVAATENTLSRDGTAPNQMEAALDMNDNRIVNLPEPITLLEPVRLIDLNDFSGGGTITVNSVPVGGTTGQVLEKHSNTDFDVTWGTATDASTVTSIAALKALDTNTGVAFLNLDGREGTFAWKTGDYSLAVSKDVNNGVYVKSDTVSAGSGCWVRDFDFIRYRSRWFGTVRDFVTDNTTVINTIIDTTDVVNTLPGAGAQSSAFIDIEGGVKFRSANLSFLPASGHIYVYLQYFNNSDLTKGVSSGGENTNENVLMSVNSGYNGDLSGGMVAEHGFYAPVHPSYVLNIAKQVSGADAHLGAGQVRIPTPSTSAKASYNIFDENVIRFRAVYDHYAGLTLNGVSLQPFAATVDIANVGSNGWPTIPSNGTVFWGVDSGARAVKTGHNINAIQGTWITGTFMEGEHITDGVTTSTTGISGGGIVFTNSSMPSLIFGTDYPSCSYGIDPAKLGTGFGIAGRTTLGPTVSGLQTNLKETVTNPGILFTRDLGIVPTSGSQIIIDGNNRLVTVPNVTLSTTGLGNIGGVTSHGTVVHAGLLPGSFNITSFLNTGAGTYRMTFPAKVSTGYSVLITPTSSSDHIVYNTKTTTTVDFACFNFVTGAAQSLSAEISVAILGGDV